MQETYTYAANSSLKSFKVGLRAKHMFIVHQSAVFEVLVHYIRL
jgi:hypothetical protein